VLKLRMEGSSFKVKIVHRLPQLTLSDCHNEIYRLAEVVGRDHFKVVLEHDFLADHVRL
jgi:hypothetical protein